MIELEYVLSWYKLVPQESIVEKQTWWEKLLRRPPRMRGLQDEFVLVETRITTEEYTFFHNIQKEGLLSGYILGTRMAPSTVATVNAILARGTTNE